MSGAAGLSMAQQARVLAALAELPDAPPPPGAQDAVGSAVPIAGAAASDAPAAAPEPAGWIEAASAWHRTAPASAWRTATPEPPASGSWGTVVTAVQDTGAREEERRAQEEARARAIDAGHRPADLSRALRSPSARRDLRRILIAYGAIGKSRRGDDSPTPIRPEDVVGAFITAGEATVERLLRSAGAISDEERIARFVAHIARAGAGVEPADPDAVVRWITTVGAILRDDPGA